MLLNLKLRLVTPMLGTRKVPKNPARQLERVANNRIAINEALWLDQMRLAAKQLGIPFKDEFVMLDEGFDTPSTNIYKRVYKKTNVEYFEAISKNNVLNIDIILRDDLPGCCSVIELKNILELVGKFFGLSPWGSKFGYGKFKVEELKPLKTNDN